MLKVTPLLIKETPRCASGSVLSDVTNTACISNSMKTPSQRSAMKVLTESVQPVSSYNGKFSSFPSVNQKKQRRKPRIGVVGEITNCICQQTCLESTSHVQSVNVSTNLATRLFADVVEDSGTGQGNRFDDDIENSKIRNADSSDDEIYFQDETTEECT
ncbi:hypothetical protein ACET3Z_005103 [Daucus carota]